jgi:hypothetical protein
MFVSKGVTYLSGKKPALCPTVIGIREYIDWSLAQPACLVYVNSHCLAVAPQSGEKQHFYFTVYYITLNSNSEAQRASKKNFFKCRR